MTTNPPEKPDGRRTSALRSGRRMRQPPRAGMTIGSLGPGNGHVVVSLRQLRSALESAVIEARGELTLLDSAYVNSACRHERTAQLSQKWLKEAGDKLPLADKLNLVRGIGAASDSRDRAIERLKIDAMPSDIWASIHTAAPTRPQDAPESDNEPSPLDGRETAPESRTDEEAA